MTASNSEASGSHTETAALVNPRLARLPFHRHELTAAGRRWQVDAVKDQDALLAEAGHFEAFPYGLLLWESAIVLADALTGLGPLAGKNVLELGAGAGLVGLAARSMGAEVVQSDHAVEALELSRRNAALNGIDGLTQILADWSNWNDARRFDLVVGSDILYDGSAHAPIAKVLDATMVAGGMALLTDPGRTATPFFIRDMRAAGFHVASQVRTVDALQPVRPGATVDVTLLDIKR